MTRRVVRSGISLEPELLAVLDGWVKVRNSPSRSEAIRSLIRSQLAEENLGDPAADAVGTVMILYRHSATNVLRRLAKAQHRWQQHIASSVHVHLKGDACLEIVALLGSRGELERAAEDIRGVKGILLGKFMIGSPGIAGGGTGHHHPHRS